MRVAPVLVLAGLLGLSVSLLSQGASAPNVPIGVWYGGGSAPPPLPPTDPPAARAGWREDLSAIRALGFTTITSWIAWAWVEPTPGRYDFDAIDTLLTQARAAGLMVNLQLFSGQAPPWLIERHPDSIVVAADGRRVAGVSCPDHPALRTAQRAFVEAAAARAGRSAAVLTIGLGDDAPPVAMGHDAGTVACVCPHSRARFQEWLRQRYTDIGALNRAWRAGHGGWSEVQPPADAGGATARHVDWILFNSTKARDDLQASVTAARAAGRVVTAHGIYPAVLLDSARRLSAPDDWVTGGLVDAWGATIFPASADPRRPFPIDLALDAIRSAGRERGWTLNALQAGPAAAGVDPGPPVTGADLRLWSWAAIARGARALAYYAWYPAGTGADARGFGLVNLDGSPTDRARAASEFAGTVARNPALFAPLRPRPGRVALLFDQFAGAGQFARSDAASAAAADISLQGIYRALAERNIAVDLMHPDEIAAGRASLYRAVFLPAPYRMSRVVAEAIKAYVRSGGTLIAEARAASIDEHGDATPRVPGHGLDELFGVREKDVRAGGLEMTFERELDGPLSGLAGRTLPGAGVAQHLEITGANVRVVARFAGAGGAPGDPALVIARHGSGRAILVGTFAGAAHAQGTAHAGELIAALAALGGATPEVRLTGGAGVETRFVESAAATVLIAINHGDEPRKVTMTFAPDTPEAIWLNLETGASVNFVAGPDGPTYTYAFKPRDVLVLMIKKEYR